MARAAGIEVMVDAADADVFEPADFFFVHQAERAANIHAGLERGLRTASRFVDFLIRRAAALLTMQKPHCAGGFELAWACLDGVFHFDMKG